MSNKNDSAWLLEKPTRSLKFKNIELEQSDLDSLIQEVVLDTIRPYGSSEHRMGQYKKIEKWEIN